jgi:hypothetical protein
MRVCLFFAAAHFLLTIVLLWVHSELVVVLLAPLALLLPFGVRSGLWFSPFAIVLPVAFASVVWSVLLYGLYILARRFLRYRPNARLRRVGRTVALLVVVADLTYLLFGPLYGFAGDRIFGVLEPVRLLEGKYHVDPLWLALSVFTWAMAAVAAYRFVIITPGKRELAQTV